MHPNLMHSPSERPAEHHTCTCSTIKAQTFKLGFALFTMRRNLTNSNLVADNFNGLSALSQSPVEYLDIYNEI